MTDITTFNNSTTLAILQNNILQYKYNPSAIQQIIVNLLANTTNGLVDIPDPTNPLIWLLEASTVNSSASMIESNLCLNKIYPSLAVNEEDLYPHMSDIDFIGIFATPASNNFIFMIQLGSLIQSMVKSDSENCNQVIIPRNTSFTVDIYTFSLQYPVIIKNYNLDTSNKTPPIIVVTYDTTEISPIMTLSTPIINSKTLTDINNITWLVFQVNTIQTEVKTVTYPIQQSNTFSQNISVNNQFYYARVWYIPTGTNNWVEIKTTFTDQVYDPNIATAVLKVTDGNLNVYIPSVYIITGLITGSVRIDVYDTLGNITVNLSTYQNSSFTTNLYAIDKKDISIYTNAMQTVMFYAYSLNLVSGGSNKVTFEALRNLIINNSTGPRNLPITNQQLYNFSNSYGYNIVTDVDIVTNRLFIATKSLPAPNNSVPTPNTPTVTLPANICIDTFICQLSNLVLNDNVFNNGNRITIGSNTLFQSINGIISIVPKSNIDSLLALIPPALVKAVNNSSYFYNPFHYVLDSNNLIFDVRPYYIDNPNVGYLNFIYNNPTANLTVNTGNYSIERTTAGYKVTLVTTSNSVYKTLINNLFPIQNLVCVQLSFQPYGETEPAGMLPSTETVLPTGEIVYTFNINTNYDFDNNDNIILTNFTIGTSGIQPLAASLNNTFTVIYTTTSVPLGFKKSNSDTKLIKTLIPNNSIAVTEESLDIILGIALDNLWAEQRCPAGGTINQVYTTAVPATYQQVIYATDPISGSIFATNSDGTLKLDSNGHLVYTILHNIGDPVLDSNNNPIMLHKVGDFVLDSNRNPIIVSSPTADRQIDMLFVDGLHYFVTDPVFINYKLQIADIISLYATTGLQPLINTLLENSTVYYYPQKALNSVLVSIGNNTTVTIESNQSFNLILYVDTSTINDDGLLATIENQTYLTLNNCLTNTVVSISDMITALQVSYGNSVKAIDLSGLGGSNNYPSVSLVNAHQKLSLATELSMLKNGNLIVVPSVNITFIDYGNN